MIRLQTFLLLMWQLQHLCVLLKLIGVGTCKSKSSKTYCLLISVKKKTCLIGRLYQKLHRLNANQLMMTQSMVQDNSWKNQPKWVIALYMLAVNRRSLRNLKKMIHLLKMRINIVPELVMSIDAGTLILKTLFALDLPFMLMIQSMIAKSMFTVCQNGIPIIKTG